MGSVEFWLLVERRKGPWGGGGVRVLLNFTDFTSTTVLLYVVLCYVPSWEIRISRIYFSVKYKRI